MDIAKVNLGYLPAINLHLEALVAGGDKSARMSRAVVGGWLASFTGQPGDQVRRTSAARQALAFRFRFSTSCSSALAIAVFPLSNLLRRP